MPHYYRLLDEKNKGKIVKADGRFQYELDSKNKTWIRSGIMLDYFSDESDKYNMFVELSEVEIKKVSA